MGYKEMFIYVNDNMLTCIQIIEVKSSLIKYCKQKQFIQDVLLGQGLFFNPIYLFAPKESKDITQISNFPAWLITQVALSKSAKQHGPLITCN